MSLMQKTRNAINTRPKIVTTLAMIGIGLAITAVLGSLTGVFDHSHIAMGMDIRGGFPGR